jgi:hypothetical protein
MVGGAARDGDEIERLLRDLSNAIRGTRPHRPAALEARSLEKVDVALLDVLRHPAVLKKERAVRAVWGLQLLLRVAAGAESGDKVRARTIVRGLAAVFATLSVREPHLSRRAPSARERDLRETFGALAPMLRPHWPGVPTFFANLALTSGRLGGADDSDEAWRARFSPALLARPGTPEADDVLRAGSESERRACARWHETYLAMMLTWPGDLSAPPVREWATRALAAPAVAFHAGPREAAHSTLARISQRRGPPGAYCPSANNLEEAAYFARCFATTVLRRAWKEDLLASTELTLTKARKTKPGPPGGGKLSDEDGQGDAAESLDSSDEFSDQDARDAAEMLETTPYSARSMRRLRRYPDTVTETAELRKRGLLARTRQREGARTLNQIAEVYSVSRGKLRGAVGRAVDRRAITSGRPGEARYFSPAEEREVLKCLLPVNEKGEHSPK